MPAEAIEKLYGEMKDLDAGGKAIAEYLIRRCNEDPSMKEDVAHEKKTMKGCMSFVKSQARKQAKDGVAIIEDKTVYEWAEDYFRQDPAKMKDEPTAVRKMQEKAQKTPEKAENGSKVVETASDEKKPTVAPKAPDRDADSKPRKKPQKKKDEVDGQMSLFDFMGAM